jgi:hypothetical protein
MTAFSLLKVYSFPNELYYHFHYKTKAIISLTAVYEIPKYFTAGSHTPIGSKCSKSLLHSGTVARTGGWNSIMDPELMRLGLGHSQLEA